MLRSWTVTSRGFRAVSIQAPVKFAVCPTLHGHATISHALATRPASGKKKELCSKSINNGHLEWSGIPKYNLFYNVCYLILMSLIWPFLKNKKGLFVFIFGIITLLFGLNNNYRFDFDQWESKWCFYSVLLPCLIIIYNKIKKL